MVDMLMVQDDVETIFTEDVQCRPGLRLHDACVRSRKRGVVESFAGRRRAARYSIGQGKETRQIAKSTSDARDVRW